MIHTKVVKANAAGATSCPPGTVKSLSTPSQGNDVIMGDEGAHLKRPFTAVHSSSAAIMEHSSNLRNKKVSSLMTALMASKNVTANSYVEEGWDNDDGNSEFGESIDSVMMDDWQ
jgi:hypothetical protein